MDENIDKYSELRISSSMDSLISSDIGPFPFSQKDFKPNLDLNQSLDNILLSNVEDNACINNDILNQSENIIIELDSLLENVEKSVAVNLSENKNFVNTDNNQTLDLSNVDLPDCKKDAIYNNLCDNPVTNDSNQEVFSLQTRNNFSFSDPAVSNGLQENIPNLNEDKNNDKENQVTFNEEKGPGISETDSSANLVKFFTDPSEFGSDYDGRKFFDSFTSQSSPGRAEPIEEQNLSSPPILESNLEPFSMPQQDNLNSCYMSEESIYEAWIPSDSTRQILYQALTSNSTPIQPTTNLTIPGIIIEEPLGDPIYDLVRQHLGDQEARKRLILTADSVPQDVVGLQQLIKADCLRAAVDLTNRLLTEVGQSVRRENQMSANTPFTLQLWFCRFSLLSRLQLYAAAECEWEAFKNLDTPDLYFEFHQSSFPNRRGSMVPFKMRVLHAEFPQFINKHQESVDRLCYMYAVIQQIMKNLNNGLAEDGSSIEIAPSIIKSSQKLWLKREIEVLHSLANCYLSMKDYLATMDIYNILLIKCTEEKEQLYSAMARLSLQVGDIVFATKYYQFAFDASTDKSADSVTQLIHRGMLEMGNGHFEEAYLYFQKVVDKDSTNVTAINNKAVCALYMGRLKEALQLYESLISIDPSKYLLEGIVLNLCTLYELESSKTNMKKLNLLRMIGQYKATGFNVSCLKMS